MTSYAPGSTNKADLAQIALELWRGVGGAPGQDKSLEAVQASLRLFVECQKAVEGEPFDVTKITGRA